MKLIRRAEKDSRTTLADLGDDWIVPFVSIVDEPAVPAAKWVAIKRKAASVTKKSPLAALRESTGRTQEEMAADLGISQPYLSQLETGARRLTPDQAVRFKSVYKCRASDLTEANAGAIVARAIATKAITPEDLAQQSRPDPFLDSLGRDNLGRRRVKKGSWQDASSDLKALREAVDALLAEEEELDDDAPEGLVEALAQLREATEAAWGESDEEVTAEKVSAGQRVTEEDAEYTDAFGVCYRRDSTGRARRVSSDS